ncbi:MAG: helix-turn-helix transcriptional regulator [Alphaproteobacteria bacterium]
MRQQRKLKQQETLNNFDNLPDSAHVRQPVVEALYACSGATLWRRVKQGLIPSPKKLGPRISGWNVGELRADLARLGSE